jgi:hypothetical protein
MTPSPSRTPQEVFAHHGTALAARGKRAIRGVLLADQPDAQWDLVTQLST